MQRTLDKMYSLIILILLDIGAGDGEVSMRLLRAIRNINSNVAIKAFATEYSWTMRDRLLEKNFL